MSYAYLRSRPRAIDSTHADNLLELRADLRTPAGAVMAAPLAIAMLGAIESLLSAVIADGMTGNPQTIGPHVLASEALNLMEKRKITSVVVVDGAGVVLGVVHLHDLWTLELI